MSRKNTDALPAHSAGLVYVRAVLIGHLSVTYSRETGVFGAIQVNSAKYKMQETPGFPGVLDLRRVDLNH
jgi:hypothetical protein